MGSIIGSANSAAAAVNSAAASIAAAVSRAASAAASMPSGGGVSRAMGVDRVPYDNYPIMAHEGEKLLTKREANQYEAATSTRGVRFISRAMGTGEIRRDNTPILAHEGEKVLTKQETRQGYGKYLVEKLADTIVIREESDVDVIMERMLRKLQKIQANMA